MGIESIVLTARGSDHDARYLTRSREKTSIIEIPAWQGELWTHYRQEYFDAHAHIFQRLGLAHERSGGEVECRFTHAQARAFLLLHIFVHELGHHVDRMSTRGQRDGSRGEDFAEAYADELLDQLWPAYVERFGDPRGDAPRSLAR